MAATRVVLASLAWPAIALALYAADDPSEWRTRLLTLWLAWLPLSLAAGAMTAFGVTRRLGFAPSALLHAGGMIATVLLRPLLSRSFAYTVNSVAADLAIYCAIAVAAWIVASRELAAKESASWDRLLASMRARAAARLEQQLLPGVIQQGLANIARSATTEPESANAVALRLARLVRMVMRTGGAEWTPLLPQARRLRIIVSLWHPHARVVLAIPRRHRETLVPGAVSAIVTRLAASASELRELRVAFAVNTLTIDACGELPPLPAASLPAGVTMSVAGERITLTWTGGARTPYVAPAAEPLPAPEGGGASLVMLAGLPLVAASSLLVRLQSTDLTLALAYIALWLAVAATSHPLIERKMLERRTPLGVLAGVFAVVNAALPLVFFVLIGKSAGFNVHDALHYSLTAFAVTGASIAAQLVRRHEWHHRRVASMSDALTAAEIVALDAHIHPHFLFNVLNTVASQLHDDPAAAARTARTLSRLVGRLTAEAGRQETPLADELSLLGDYLDVERARFGERVRLQLAVDERARDVPVPRLSLLTLVQNAMKHGVAKMQRPCEIRVACRLRGRALEVVVTNDVREGAASEVRHGLGLRQLRRRLRLLYGERATGAFRMHASRFEAALAIPRG